MLMGEYHHSIDEKGRITIPSKFREILGEQIIITRGLENCLFMYSKKEWDRVILKLNELPFTQKDARNFTRIFLSGATTIDIDKQGRINLPDVLLDFASITKDVVILGVSKRVEIWSKESWDTYFNKTKEEFSTLADHLFDITN